MDSAEQHPHDDAVADAEARQEEQDAEVWHPAPGWMSLIPVPGSEIKPPIQAQLQMPPQLQQFFEERLGVTEEDLRAAAQADAEEKADEIVGPRGVMSGVIQEMNLEDIPREFPYGPGDTVCFPRDRGIPIGGMRFLVIDRVCAWRHADE